MVLARRAGGLGRRLGPAFPALSLLDADLALRRGVAGLALGDAHLRIFRERHAGLVRGLGYPMR